MAANPGFVPAITSAAARSTREQLSSQLVALERRRNAALATAQSVEGKANALYAKAEMAAKELGAA